MDLLTYLVDKDLYNWISPIYPETTTTMETNWSNLQTLEVESLIKIITGASDVDTGFEEFRTAWYDQGGEMILKEIEEQIAE